MGSLLTSVAFENAGKPAVAVIGTEFIPYTEAQKRIAGMSSLKVVVVPYPLGAEAEARKKAEGALQDIVNSIRGAS